MPARFPTIRAGVVHADGLVNGPSPDALRKAFQQQQAVSLDRFRGTPISEVPSIVAWRRTFSAFGVQPTRYRNAAEALIRRLTKAGDIPSINCLVDIANLVSIRYGLPVAAMDQERVAGSTTVRFAQGDERFNDLGSSRTTSPEVGEVIFVDRVGTVSARRWCWRQSAQSATGPDTVEALYTVEGHHEGAEEDVASATRDLVALLEAHQPQARIESARLSPSRPRYEPDH
ncbi:MAG: phenylalanine--tRNA ligase beta subunit-related protein [bacterium]|nr:phenylalanine--tRNA ligase beta subunit-related protein [bacterium]